jgi:hypothetical protein
MRAAVGPGIAAILALCLVSGAAADSADEREDLVERRIPEDVPAKIVFVTSETYDGKEVGDGSPEGGAAGGDSHRQKTTAAAGLLAGGFKVWLSDWTSSPAERAVDINLAPSNFVVTNAKDSGGFAAPSDPRGQRSLGARRHIL